MTPDLSAAIERLIKLAPVGGDLVFAIENLQRAYEAEKARTQTLLTYAPDAHPAQGNCSTKLLFITSESGHGFGNTRQTTNPQDRQRRKGDE